MSTDSLEERCQGRCKGSNKPCAISWDLDVMGYCKYHSPIALQCRGTIPSGERCGIRWDLDANLLCENHTSQEARCHGGDAVLGKRKRCSNTSVNHHGFCPNHPARLEDTLRDFARAVLRVDAFEAFETKLNAQLVAKAIADAVKTEVQRNPREDEGCDKGDDHDSSTDEGEHEAVSDEGENDVVKKEEAVKTEP